METATRLKKGDRVEVVKEDIDGVIGTSMGTQGTVMEEGSVLSPVRFDGLERNVFVYTNFTGLILPEVRIIEDVPEKGADQPLTEDSGPMIDPASLAHMERRNAFQEELGRLVNVLNDLGDVTISSWELTGNKHDQFVFSMEFQTHKEAN